MMEKSRERFYIAFFVFMVVITVMILFVKPPKQLKNRNMDSESKKIVAVLNLKYRIDEYKKINKEYPKTIESFKRFYDTDIDELAEYQVTWDDYIIKTKFEIDSQILILTKDKILKERNEEQNMGGD